MAVGTTFRNLSLSVPLIKHGWLECLLQLARVARRAAQDRGAAGPDSAAGEQAGSVTVAVGSGVGYQEGDPNHRGDVQSFCYSNGD